MRLVVVTIGRITKPRDEAIDIMEMAVKGDKTYSMFPALVSTRLNVMIGNPYSCIADTITIADCSVSWMTTITAYSAHDTGIKK